MSEKKGGKSRNFVEYTLLAMVGTQLVVSIFIGFAIGYWLDTKIGTKPLLMLVFGIFGIAAGFLNIYRTVKNRVEEE